MRFLLSITIFLSSFALIGQGLPPVLNFSQKDYNAHYQNWNIAQDSSGIMYFGNTNGLLSYNGNSWRLQQMNGNKVVRSVYYFQDKIFTGAYDEFGYWSNEKQELKFNSLNKLIPGKRLQKEEVWNIIDCYGKLYFQSFSVLLTFDGKQIKEIITPDNFMFAHKVNNELYIQILGKGIYKINKKDSLELINNSQIFKDNIVTGIISTKNGLMISTNSHGIFILINGKVSNWKNELQNYFESVQINRLLLTKNGKLCVGTIGDGLLVFDEQENLLFHINKANGLNNNTVLSIFEDEEQNIWCGLDNGISLIRLNSNSSYYNDKTGKIGNIFASVQKDSILYIGTNHGVFYYDLSLKNSVYKEKDFNLVKGTQGQVWQLKKIDNKIICGHNEGTFLIDKFNSLKISNITGGWCLNEVKKDIFLQSTYTGFCTYNNNGNWISNVKKVIGFDLPIKKYVMINSYEAIGLNPSTGLYHLIFNEDFSKIVDWSTLTLGEDFENKYEIDLSKVGGVIYVLENGIQYKYDSKFLKFNIVENSNPPAKYREIDNLSYFKLYEDSIGIADGKFNFSLPQKVNQEYYSSSKLADGKYLFSIDEGFVIIKKENKVVQNKLNKPIIFDYIESNGQRKYFNKNDIELSYNERSFNLYLYQSTFNINSDIKISLESDKEFYRSLENKSHIEYYNLAPGKYKLKAISNNGESTQVFSVVINQPWYKSNLAYFIYLILLFSSAVYIKRHFDKQLLSEKQKLEEENKRILHEHKIELENIRLHEQNILKSKELANTTMHLVQKNEILTEIKTDLTDLRKSGQALQSNKEFQNLVKRIDFNLSVEDDKNLFETNFEEVHHDFLKKLESEFPDLTQADLKLAAYLRMNLSSKDICPLLNISIRGLENKRYRLRKKLGLSNDIILSTYFQKYI